MFTQCCHLDSKLDMIFPLTCVVSVATEEELQSLNMAMQAEKEVRKKAETEAEREKRLRSRAESEMEQERQRRMEVEGEKEKEREARGHMEGEVQQEREMRKQAENSAQKEIEKRLEIERQVSEVRLGGYACFKLCNGYAVCDADKATTGVNEEQYWWGGRGLRRAVSCG